MINQQLLDFIKQQLQTNVPKEKIIEELLANGWSKEDVHEGFNNLNTPNINMLDNRAPIPEEKKRSGGKIFLIILLIILLGGGAGLYYFRDNLVSLSIIEKVINFKNKILGQEEEIPIQTEETGIVQEENNVTINQVPEIVNKNVLFRENAKNYILGESNLLEGKDLSEIELKLPGQLYNPPKEFVVIDKEFAKYDTPINAAIADFSAFKANDDDWIISNFVIEEQNYPLSLLKNKELYEKTKKYYETLTGIKIFGEVTYDIYSIVLVQYTGDTIKTPLIFKFVTGEWKKTNALSNDKKFGIVFSALYNGEVVEVE